MDLHHTPSIVIGSTDGSVTWIRALVCGLFDWKLRFKRSPKVIQSNYTRHAMKAPEWRVISSEAVKVCNNQAKAAPEPKTVIVS